MHEIKERGRGISPGFLNRFSGTVGREREETEDRMKSHKEREKETEERTN